MTGSQPSWRRVVFNLGAIFLIIFQLFVAFPAAVVHAAGASHLVISQIQTGGVTTTDEFIELYNPTSSPIDLSAWSVQYRGSKANTFYKTVPTGTIQAGAYFLLGRLNGYQGNVTVDDTYSEFSLSGDGGTVFLVDSTTLLTTADFGSSSIIDSVAYGTGALYGEGTPSDPPISGGSIIRVQDMGNNSVDFIPIDHSEPRDALSIPGSPALSTPVVNLTPGNGQITADWGPISTATDYEVTITASGFSQVDKLTARTDVITGLTDGTTYSVKIRAHRQIDNAFSNYSDTQSATPTLPTLATPDLTLNPNSGQIDASWLAVPNAINYDLELAGCATDSFVGPDLSHSFTNIPNNVACTVTLQALAAPGYLASAVASKSITIIPPSPIDTSLIYTATGSTTPQTLFGVGNVDITASVPTGQLAPGDMLAANVTRPGQAMVELPLVNTSSAGGYDYWTTNGTPPDPFDVVPANGTVLDGTTTVALVDLTTPGQTFALINGNGSFTVDTTVSAPMVNITSVCSPNEDWLKITTDSDATSVKIYSDAALTNFITSATPTNGVIDQLYIGDNKFNQLWLVATDAAGNVSAATLVTNTEPSTCNVVSTTAATTTITPPLVVYATSANEEVSDMNAAVAVSGHKGALIPETSTSTPTPSAGATITPTPMPSPTSSSGSTTTQANDHTQVIVGVALALILLGIGLAVYAWFMGDDTTPPPTGGSGPKPTPRVTESKPTSRRRTSATRRRSPPNSRTASTQIAPPGGANSTRGRQSLRDNTNGSDESSSENLSSRKTKW